MYYEGQSKYMVAEIVCISLGAPVGFLIRNQPLLIKIVDYSLIMSVRILLFLLGLSLGSNSTIIQQLDKLGIQAIIITFFCISGSLIAAKLLSRFVHIIPQNIQEHLK